MRAEALLIVLLSGVVHIFGAEKDPLEYELSTQTFLETPHIKWAKPYFKEKLSVLFIIRGRGTPRTDYNQEACTIREVVELSQRFDIEPAVVLYCGKGTIYGGTKGMERFIKLLSKRYDVFALTVPYDWLPVEAQYKILKQVSEGAGIVSFHHRPQIVLEGKRKWLFDTRRKLPLPAFLKSNLNLTDVPVCRRTGIRERETLNSYLIGVYRMGKGRGAHLLEPGGSYGLSPYLPCSFETLNEFEFWMALSGSVVLWSAGREPSVVFRGIETRRITRAKLPAVITASFDTGGEDGLKAQAEIRRLDGFSLSFLERETNGYVKLQLPVLPAGVYFVSVRLLRGGKVVGYGLDSFRVLTECNVSEVKLDRPFAEVGEEISGKISIEGKLDKSYRLLLRTVDLYQRVLQEVVLQPLPEVAFSVKVLPGTIYRRLEVVILDRSGEVSRAKAEFTVPVRRRGQFNMVIWNAPSHALGYYASRKLAESGYHIQLGGLAKTLLYTDFSVIPYTTRILSQLDMNGVMTPFCWNDAKKRSEFIKGRVRSLVPVRQHGAFLYSLGDEVSTSGACAHPECVKTYRKFLQARYKTIQKLNKHWKTNYKSFDEITVNRGDVMEEKAFTSGNFGRWLDRQLFACWNFASFCGKFVEAYSKLDPKAITGFEGAGRFGVDFDAIIEKVGFWSPYHNIADEVIRSIAPEGFIRGNWSGYDKTAPPLIQRAWITILSGGDSLWWWRWDGIGRWRGFIRPTFDLWEATEELTRDTAILRQGLGDLLVKSEMIQEPIAFYYSLPSFFASSAHKIVDYTKQHYAFFFASVQSGYPFRYITEKGLLSGQLKGARVLVLPLTQAIGEEEARIIESFVRDGGTLVCDLYPGIFNNHLSSMNSFLLDNLLGIEHRGEPRGVRKQFDLTVEFLGRKLHLYSDSALFDASFKPTTARASAEFGGIPILLVNSVGSGRAILLNFPLQYYSENRFEESASWAPELVDAIYSSAGAQPVARISTRATEVRGWRIGSGTLLAFLPYLNSKEEPEALRAKVELPSRSFIYDLRRRKYIGNKSKFTLPLIRGRATFLACLPQKLGTLSIQTEKGELKRGEALRLTARVRGAPQKLLSAFYLSAESPDGSRPLFMRKVLIARGGEASFEIPLALNEAPGRWTFSVKELYTQKTASVVVMMTR